MQYITNMHMTHSGLTFTLSKWNVLLFEITPQSKILYLPGQAKSFPSELGGGGGGGGVEKM